MLITLTCIQGKPPNDVVTLKELNLKETSKIMMVGTVEEEIMKISESSNVYPEVVNDLDIEEEEVEICNR